MADTVSFSDETMKKYEWLLTRYPTRRAALLPTLRLAEAQFGALGIPEMRYVADLMEIPPAAVFGVVTFYTHYRRAGVGKFHMQVCSTLSCGANGTCSCINWHFINTGGSPVICFIPGVFHFSIKHVVCVPVIK